MVPHIILVLFLFIFSLIEKSRQVQLEINSSNFFPCNRITRFTDKDIPYLCIIVSMIIFRLLVDSYWGVDAKEYEEIYYQPAKELSFIKIIGNRSFASPFLFISKFFSFISWNYWSFRLFLCSFYIIFIACFIRKWSVHAAFCFFVFYSIACNQILLSFRQTMSFCFFLLSFAFILEKKYIRSVLFAVFAIFVHTIALAGVGVYVLMIKKKRFNLLSILVIFLLSYLFSSKIVDLVILKYRYGMYKAIGELENGGQTLLVVQFVILFFYYFLLKLKRINNRKINFYFNNYVFACSLQFFALRFATFNRCRLFYLIGFAMLSGEVLNYINNNLDKKIYKILVAFIAALFYLYTFATKYPFISAIQNAIGV